VNKSSLKNIDDFLPIIDVTDVLKTSLLSLL